MYLVTFAEVAWYINYSHMARNLVPYRT